jgi:signal transduction histidine kinase
MITGSGDEKIAVETMKRGADDYLVKDVAGGWLDLLPGVIERVIAQRRLKQEKDRIEYQLRESEMRRAEAERLASVSRTVARVAHEINNPLASIRSAFQLVKAAVPEGHPDLEFAVAIEKEIDRIARIVSRMYQLYPAVQPPPDGFRVGEVLGDVLKLIRPVAGAANVRLENGVGRIACGWKTASAASTWSPASPRIRYGRSSTTC